MTTYLSSLSSHYTSLKRLLPSGAASDSDAQTTDPNDSAVSRVLRAYYAEKGRPFPPWLGPDPRAPAQAAQAAPAYLTSTGRNPAGGAAGPASHRAHRGGLGDLFGDPPAQSPGPEEPTSLRHGRRGANLRPPALAGRANASSDAIPYPARVPGAPTPTARPLPSQRAGSYQNRFGGGGDSGRPDTGGSDGGKTSMQDRLRARLGGARSTSPAPSPSPSGSFGGDYGGGGSGGGGSGNPYARPLAESSGSGYNPYEGGDLGEGRYQSYAASGAGRSGGSSNPYLAAPGGDPYGADGSRSGDRPYTGAASPWVSGDDLGGDLATERRRGPGLPSSPRRWK